MIRLSWRSPRWRGIVALTLMTPLIAAGFVFWRATRAREFAAAEIRDRSQLPVRVIPLDRQAISGIEPIAASPAFRDVALYRDTIVVSARAGLHIYDRSGVLARIYRAGLELPSVELGAIAVGVAAESGEPELFVATRGAGLLAFNGSRFRQILPSDPDLRFVTSVLVLNSGRVLLGTEKRGLLVFDGRGLAPFHDQLRTEHITALSGSDGDLWIGTLARGLLHYRAGQLEDLRAALPDPQVLSIAAAEGAIYAGTPLGVVEFRDGRRSRTLADGFFAQSLAAAPGTLRVGTEDEGVLEIPLQTRPSPRSDRRDVEGPASIRRLATMEGATYAVSDATVYRYETEFRRWRPVLTAGSVVLADRNIAALAVHSGRLWVGYFDRGLDVVEPGLDRAVHHETDAIFCVNRIVPEPSRQRTAVATANGLVLFDAGGRPRQVMGRKDGFLADHVTDVAFREDGMVVATPAGLSFVDRAGVRSLYVFHGLVNNHVYTVAARGSQTAVGTLGGLSLLDADAVRANFTTANSHLKHNWITALARVGDEWFAGTYGAGVLRLDASGEWSAFPDLKDGFVVNPNAMAASGGRVYGGSLDRGLFVYDAASGRWTNTTAGLPSPNVTAIAAGDGYVYIGTDNGLVRVAEGALR